MRTDTDSLLKTVASHSYCDRIGSALPTWDESAVLLIGDLVLNSRNLVSAVGDPTTARQGGVSTDKEKIVTLTNEHANRNLKGKLMLQQQQKTQMGKFTQEENQSHQAV